MATYKVNFPAFIAELPFFAHLTPEQQHTLSDNDPEIVAGAQVSPEDRVKVKILKAAARALCMTHGIPPDVLCKIENKCHTVQNEVARAMLPPPQPVDVGQLDVLAQILAEIAAARADIADLKAVVTLSNAECQNFRARLVNESPGAAFRPIKKVNAGYGTEKAVPLFPGLNIPNLEVAPEPTIGDQPEHFPAALGPLFSMTKKELARLIVFYNDDFGILAEDSLAQMKEKLTRWITNGKELH